MSYRANNGRKFFDEKQIKDGVYTSPTSWQPLWAVKGEDGQPSWAIDRRVFWLDLPRYKVHTIVKTNKRTAETFTVSYADFEKYGKEGDWGHGEQVALPFCFWQIEQGKVPQKRVPKAAKPKVIKHEKTWLQRTFLGG
jgi:hypothetical protein